MPSSPVHVHVVNDPGAGSVFHVTARQVWAALRQAGCPAGRVALSIGLGATGYGRAMRSADVLFAYHFPHRELAKAAPRLKWIHQIGAGVDHLLPLDWLPKGVALTNSSGVHVAKAGEFITCALLMLNNLFPRHVTHQRMRRWAPAFSGLIAGKTVLVIGVGAVGGEAARRAKDLGLRVIGIRRSARPNRYVDRMYGPDELAKALPQADFVVLTAPLTSLTRGMLGRKELEWLRPGAALLNMGRGAVVDSSALARKLRRGELAGAILDVFEQEPLRRRSPLWTCPNLIVTPHVSADSPDYMDRVVRVFAHNLQRFLSERRLRNRVDTAAEY